VAFVFLWSALGVPIVLEDLIDMDFVLQEMYVHPRVLVVSKATRQPLFVAAIPTLRMVPAAVAAVVFAAAGHQMYPCLPLLLL
jgi:hypothetical protein